MFVQDRLVQDEKWRPAGEWRGGKSVAGNGGGAEWCRAGNRDGRES
jgi:hypothetical protein